MGEMSVPMTSVLGYSSAKSLGMSVSSRFIERLWVLERTLPRCLLIMRYQNWQIYNSG